MKRQKFDVVDRIIAYEQGELSERDTLELFSYLIQTGQAWTLQGHYGRTARGLMDAGFIDAEGNVNQERFDFFEQAAQMMNES